MTPHAIRFSAEQWAAVVAAAARAGLRPTTLVRELTLAAVAPHLGSGGRIAAATGGPIPPALLGDGADHD